MSEQTWKVPTKQEWIDALESGRFRQTTGVLCRTSGTDGNSEAGMCCLGVLAELAGFDSRVSEYDGKGVVAYLIPPELNDLGTFELWERTDLPAKFVDQVLRTQVQEIRTTGPGSPNFGPGLVARLINMNDRNQGFGEIVKFLRELPERPTAEDAAGLEVWGTT